MTKALIRDELASWETRFWEVCRERLEGRFGSGWRMSPETSIRLHAGNRWPWNHALVHAPSARDEMMVLSHGTLIQVQRKTPSGPDTVLQEGLRAMPLVEALCEASPSFWHEAPKDVVACLATVDDPVHLARAALAEGRVNAARRFAGAFRELGRPGIAEEILAVLRAAGHAVKEDPDPFGVPVEFAFAA